MSSKEIGTILTYRNKGSLGAGGQQVGADGSGDFAIVFYGNPDEAHDKAIKYVKKLQKHYRVSIDNVMIVAAYEGYCGDFIKFIEENEQFKGE